MACLLVLIVAAAVLTGPPGKLTHAARTSPAEAFWRAALPGAPMPEAIRELLRPGPAGTDDDDSDFNYGYGRSSPRNEDAAPSADVLAGRVAGALMPEAIRELMRHGSAGTDGDDSDFNYGYSRSSPRNEDAAPSADVLAGRVAGAQRFRTYTVGDDDDDDDPVINLRYDGSSARNEAASPSAEVLNRAAGARNAAAASPTVFFLEEAVRVGGVLPIHSMTLRGTAANAAAAASSPPLRLYTVRGVRAVDGSRFVVCRRDRGAGAGAGPGAADDNERDDAVYVCRATTGPARAYVVRVVRERAGKTATAAVVCRTDASRWRRAFRLLGVKPGGAAAVCHAALDAQVIPVKNDRSSSSLA